HPDVRQPCRSQRRLLRSASDSSISLTMAWASARIENNSDGLVRLARTRETRAPGPARLVRAAGVYTGPGPRSVKQRLVEALAAGLGAWLEDLVDRAALVGELHHAQAGRDAERRRRLVLEDLLGHRLVDRRGIAAAGLEVAVAERLGLVEADIDADGDVGRRAQEPVVARVVGRAGLAGD